MADHSPTTPDLTGSPTVGIARRLFRAAWSQIREFSGYGGRATTYLGARWFVLRAVGVVFILVFGGIIDQGQAMIGPHGISPIGTLLEGTRNAYPGGFQRFLLVPSLFWLGSGKAAILLLEWLGIAAAIALVLNIWPRMALFACWLLFLSFISVWGAFSPAQLDDLMLEVALLCIPFAPPGIRPGYAANSPPPPIAVFMIRLFLLRVILEAGLVKFISGDPHWRDFTALDVMYVTAPFPTILGYLDHQMSHGYHLFEYWMTFAAEFAGPLLAVFAGRRGRWFAFAVWGLFQAGIELTCNFGWLNTASIAMGVLFLDDQMLAGALGRLGLRRASGFLATGGALSPGPSAPGWGRRLLCAAFCLQLYLAAISFGTFVRILRRLPLDNAPWVVAAPRDFFANFHSANSYALYARFDPVRYGVEYQGSNDGGRSWRPYEYRYISQRTDRICPYIAPWFSRFEASIEGPDPTAAKLLLFRAVAGHLLAGNPEIIGLFSGDPFPDRPPTLVRLRLFRLSFTDLETHRRTGQYWRKFYSGDYLPPLFINERGRIEQSNLASGDEDCRFGAFNAGIRLYAREFNLGVPDAGMRLANLLERGVGIPRNPGKAFEIYTLLAGRGEVEAICELGNCFENGEGTQVDYDKAAVCFRAAAARGSVLGLYNLGGLYARDQITPADDVEGLALLREAAGFPSRDPAMSRYVAEDRAGFARALQERMPAWEISNARLRAASRVRADDPVGAGLQPTAP